MLLLLAYIMSVGQRVAKFLNFDAKSFMFLWNILLKDFSPFVQHDHFVHSKMFCRIVQFTKFVVHIKEATVTDNAPRVQSLNNSSTGK
jgi:hypothetical protein